VDRWIRYGQPMIPAMVVGMIAEVYVAFPPPYAGPRSD
jgi:hypothetical protein